MRICGCAKISAQLNAAAMRETSSGMADNIDNKGELSANG